MSSDTPIEFGDQFGNVISLVVRRYGLFRKKYHGACQHRRITVDPEYTQLECRDCGKQLNPVEWLANKSEFYQGLQYERHRWEAAKKHYEVKSKCKCEHCGKMTRIKPASGAEVRKFEERKQ